jgi:hypothetical protein
MVTRVSIALLLLLLLQLLFPRPKPIPVRCLGAVPRPLLILGLETRTGADRQRASIFCPRRAAADASTHVRALIEFSMAEGYNRVAANAAEMAGAEWLVLNGSVTQLADMSPLLESRRGGAEARRKNKAMRSHIVSLSAYCSARGWPEAPREGLPRGLLVGGCCQGRGGGEERGGGMRSAGARRGLDKSLRGSTETRGELLGKRRWKSGGVAFFLSSVFYPCSYPRRRPTRGSSVVLTRVPRELCKFFKSASLTDPRIIQ